MASVIKSRTISSVVDNRIQLVNSNFARPFNVGTWTQIRVAVRMIMDNTGANLTSTPKFYLGLCSGNTGLPLDASTTHFLGFITDVATWSYFTTIYRYVLSGVKLAKKVGTTITYGGSILSTVVFSAGVTDTNRFMFFCDITKGAPNFTVQGFHRNTATAGDVVVPDFLGTAELSTPSFTNHTFPAGGTLAVSEGTDGYFDHVCVAWNRSTPVMEICDLSVVKLA